MSSGPGAERLLDFPSALAISSGPIGTRRVRLGSGLEWRGGGGPWWEEVAK
jgi:hypothetical protein